MVKNGETRSSKLARQDMAKGCQARRLLAFELVRSREHIFDGTLVPIVLILTFAQLFLRPAVATLTMSVMGLLAYSKS
jgi:hypothetical protein